MQNIWIYPYQALNYVLPDVSVQITSILTIVIKSPWSSFNVDVDPNHSSHFHGQRCGLRMESFNIFIIPFFSFFRLTFLMLWLTLLKNKNGGHGASSVDKVIWKSVPWEQQFSVNNSGIFERSFWIKQPDSARSETFWIIPIYN